MPDLTLSLLIETDAPLKHGRAVISSMDAYLPIISEVCCGLIQRGYVIYDLPTMPFLPDETVAILATKSGIKHLILVIVTDAPSPLPLSVQQRLNFRAFYKQSQPDDTFLLFVELLTSSIDWHAAGLEPTSRSDITGPTGLPA